MRPELWLPALRLLPVEVSSSLESEVILVRAATRTCTRTVTAGTGSDTVSRPPLAPS